MFNFVVVSMLKGLGTVREESPARTTPPSSPELGALTGDLMDFDVLLPKDNASEGQEDSREGNGTKRKRAMACVTEGQSTTPPDSPPGEAFASRFLREYENAGRLLEASEVSGLASTPARKWGLARELPAGWYVVDDSPAPGQVLPHFDSTALPPCGWKVTGPQMKGFNPKHPVQIRYGNPKDGCTKEYGAMRAAVYTWCRKDAAGAVVEGSVKLIHVYVGRASRSRKYARRPAVGRSRRDPSALTQRAANPAAVGCSYDFSDSHRATPPWVGATRQAAPVASAERSETQARQQPLRESPPALPQQQPPQPHPLNPPAQHHLQQRLRQEYPAGWGSAPPAEDSIANMRLLSKILYGLKQAAMPDAARLVQVVIADHLATTVSVTALSPPLPSLSCILPQPREHLDADAICGAVRVTV